MKKKERLNRILTDIRVLSQLLDTSYREITKSGKSYYMVLSIRDDYYYAIMRAIKDIHCMAEMKEGE